MDLVSLLVTVLIAGLIFGLVYWLIGQIPMPPPFRTVALVIMAVIAILFLLSLVGGIPHFGGLGIHRGC